MIVYKIDVLDALKHAGYNTNRLRKETALGENAIQSLRTNKMVGIKSLNVVCQLLGCQPGDILAYQDEKKPKD